jgi:alanine-synthesizing transaminase
MRTWLASLGRFRALTFIEAYMTDKTGVQSVRHFSRIDRLPPYVFNITAELKMAARRRGEDIIDFSMGNPDGATPPHIVEKLCAVAQRDDTHGYSTSRGIPRLRRAIANWYQTRYQVDIDPEDEAIVTIGSKEGLAHLMLATLDHGDTVLVLNPSYPIHIYGAVIAGAQVRSVPLVPGVDFFVELERAIRESIPKPKMIILGFPSNPTAQCVELDFFERVVALAKQYDIIVVHDLAYADIVYDGWTAPSIMQVPGARDVAVEFFTLSKSYNMAGWRIGFMVGNKELVHALARIKSYHDYGTFTPLQVAAIAALEGDQQCVRDIAEQYRQRRNVLVKGLHEAGWMVDNPKASMYVWAKIPDHYRELGSLEFSKKLLSDAKVCVSPGIGFGDYGDDYVRFALIENRDRIRQAVRGIKAMFRQDGVSGKDETP